MSNLDLSKLLKVALENPPAPDKENGEDKAMTLYAYLLDELDSEKKEWVEAQLAHSEEWQREFEAVKEDYKAGECMDVTMPPKRAAGKGDVIRAESQNGLYSITIRPQLDNPDRGVLVLESRKKELEGRRVLVWDGAKRELLRGLIAQGRASQRLDALNTIDLSRLTVVSG